MADMDDVVSAVNNVEKQVKAGADSNFGWLIFLAIVMFSPTTTWVTLNKVWYSTTTDAVYNNVYVQKEPTDCDWAHSPIGNKDCDYKRVVAEYQDASTTRMATTYVWVSWEKQ